MAFSCGFYNSLNGDRKYNTRQISEIFDGIIRDGVYMSIGEKLTVKEGTGMQISVGTGRAWFNHSWSLVDSELPLTVEQSDLVLDRIDAVVLEVNESNETRNNVIKMVKGTAASSPQKPTMTNTEFVHQYPLAYISVKKGATEITTANIEINVGKDDCPYVTSILEAVSIEELYAQWEAQFKGWEEGQKTQFEEWFEEIKGQLSEDAAGNLQVQIDDVKSSIENEGIQIYTHSKSGTVHKFTGNGSNGRALMTDNVATGDTFTVNGSPVTAYMGAENAVDSMTGNTWNGKWVTFVYDGNAINFKGGGGLSAADRAKLIPENLRKDVVLFAGTPREVVGSLTWQDLLPEKLVVVRNGQSAEPDIFGNWIHMGVDSTSYGPDCIYVGHGSNRKGDRSSLQIDCSLWSRIEFDAKLTYYNTRDTGVRFGITNDLTADVNLGTRFDKYVQAYGVGNRTTYAVELPVSGKYYIKVVGSSATAEVYNITLIKRE